MDHILNEKLGERDLINNLGSLHEKLYKTIKKFTESIVYLESSKDTALSAVVQFRALKSIMFSYLERTGLKSSLMGLAKSY